MPAASRFDRDIPKAIAAAIGVARRGAGTDDLDLKRRERVDTMTASDLHTLAAIRRSKWGAQCFGTD
jgi:hypothetical protein